MALALTRRLFEVGEMCAICLDEFPPNELGVTHEGIQQGVPHGFHEACLWTWFSREFTCPLCRQLLDSESLLSRTERIWKRLRPALIEAGATFIGLLTVGAQIVAESATEKVASIAAAVGGAAVMIVGSIIESRAREAAASTTVIMAPAAAAVMGMGMTGMIGAEAMRVGAGMGGAIGVITNLILDPARVALIVRQNICFGVVAGGVAAIAAKVELKILTEALTIALVGSVAAGALSLARRR